MSYDVEKINPYDSPLPKKEQVEAMFDRIAPGYDKLNEILSLGIDRYWRREAVKTLRPYKPRYILDIATGTADLAIMAHEILHPETIVATDISEEMMRVGRRKVKNRGLQHIIAFDRQDAAAIAFPDETFDAVTVAFGVRNFENIDKSFAEVLRVLKPGGLFVFLELTTPQLTPVKQIYSLYAKHLMPRISAIMAAERRAYRYLPQSVKAVPQGREMMLILRKNGFEKIRLRRLTLGIATLYIAEKSKNN